MADPNLTNNKLCKVGIGRPVDLLPRPDQSLTHENIELNPIDFVTFNWPNMPGKRKRTDTSANTAQAPRRKRQRTARRLGKRATASGVLGPLSVDASISAFQSRSQFQRPQVSMAPVAINHKIRTNSPLVTRSTDGRSATVTNSELISSSITGPNGSAYYDPVFVQINPGLAISFPWLAPLARQFQLYRFEYLEFEFVPSVGSQNSGDVILSPSYVSSNAPPINEAQAMSAHGAMEGTVWQSLSCVMNPIMMQAFANRGGFKYVRAGTAAGDIRTTDGGYMILALASLPNPALANYGKLLVHYRVSLQEPVFNLTANEQYASQTTSLWSTVPQAITGTQTPVNFTTIITDGLKLAFTNTIPTSTFYLPAGIYDVNFRAQMQYTLSAAAVSSYVVYANILLNGAQYGPSGAFPLSTTSTATQAFGTVDIRGQLSVTDSQVAAGTNNLQVTVNLVAITAGSVSNFELTDDTFIYIQPA